MTAEHVAIWGIIIACGSELIALNPKLSSNSWIELLMNALKSAFPKKSSNDEG